MTSGSSLTAAQITAMSLIAIACGTRHGGRSHGRVAAKSELHSAGFMLAGLRLAGGSRPEHTKLRLNSPEASLPWLSIGEAGRHITTVCADIKTFSCIVWRGVWNPARRSNRVKKASAITGTNSHRTRPALRRNLHCCVLYHLTGFEKSLPSNAADRWSPSSGQGLRPGRIPVHPVVASVVALVIALRVAVVALLVLGQPICAGLPQPCA